VLGTNITKGERCKTMTGHTQITEEEAKKKKCKRADHLCRGSKCMGWPECKKLWEDKEIK